MSLYEAYGCGDPDTFHVAMTRGFLTYGTGDIDDPPVDRIHLERKNDTIAIINYWAGDIYLICHDLEGDSFSRSLYYQTKNDPPDIWYTPDDLLNFISLYEQVQML